MDVPVASAQPVVEPLFPMVVLTAVVMVAIVQPEPPVASVPQTSIITFEEPSQAKGVVNVCEFTPTTGAYVASVRTFVNVGFKKVVDRLLALVLAILNARFDMLPPPPLAHLDVRPELDAGAVLAGPARVPDAGLRAAGGRLSISRVTIHSV